MHLKGVDVVWDKWDEAEAMRYEFIIQSWCVLFDLNDVNRHSGHFGNDDAAQSISDVQFGVAEFEVKLVTSTAVQNADRRLWTLLQSALSGINLHSTVERAFKQVVVWLPVHI